MINTYACIHCGKKFEWDELVKHLGDCHEVKLLAPYRDFKPVHS